MKNSVTPSNLTDEERIHGAAQEMFAIVKDALPEVLLEFIPELLFVGEEGVAIDCMVPYYKESQGKLSQASLKDIEELHELKL